MSHDWQVPLTQGLLESATQQERRQHFSWASRFGRVECAWRIRLPRCDPARRDLVYVELHVEGHTQETNVAEAGNADVEVVDEKMTSADNVKPAGLETPGLDAPTQASSALEDAHRVDIGVDAVDGATRAGDARGAELTRPTVGTTDQSHDIDLGEDRKSTHPVMRRVDRNAQASGELDAETGQVEVAATPTTLDIPVVEYRERLRQLWAKRMGK